VYGPGRGASRRRTARAMATSRASHPSSSPAATRAPGGRFMGGVNPEAAGRARVPVAWLVWVGSPKKNTRRQAPDPSGSSARRRKQKATLPMGAPSPPPPAWCPGVRQEPADPAPAAPAAAASVLAVEGGGLRRGGALGQEALQFGVVAGQRGGSDPEGATTGRSTTQRHPHDATPMTRPTTRRSAHGVCERSGNPGHPPAVTHIRKRRGETGSFPVGTGRNVAPVGSVQWWTKQARV